MRQRVLASVRQQGSASVAELARRLGEPESKVRKAVEALAHEGTLVQVAVQYGLSKGRRRSAAVSVPTAPVAWWEV